jgi:hypothetical protein
MSSQIFKEAFPTFILQKLLDSIAIKITNGYVINHNVYKKGLFNEKIIEFIKECMPYYHVSKRKYLEKKLTYNSFVTIIRQICNFNKITYTNKIKYENSQYDIVYYVYLP